MQGINVCEWMRILSNFAFSCIEKYSMKWIYLWRKWKEGERMLDQVSSGLSRLLLYECWIYRVLTYHHVFCLVFGLITCVNLLWLLASRSLEFALCFVQFGSCLEGFRIYWQWQKKACYSDHFWFLNLGKSRHGPIFVRSVSQKSSSPGDGDLSKFQIEFQSVCVRTSIWSSRSVTAFTWLYFLSLSYLYFILQLLQIAYNVSEIQGWGDKMYVDI